MELTKKILVDLKDSGKEVCIYSDDISKNLIDYGSNDFNFSRTSYYFWTKNQRPIPMGVVLKIMDEKKLNSIFVDFLSMGGGNKMSSFNEMGLNFCYLLGLILGDGCMIHRKRDNNRNSYSINICFRIEEKANKIKLLVKNLFGIDSPIYPARGCYVLATFSKPLVLILNRKYDIPIGLKYNSICVPKLILNGDKDMKISFLKGVFESDGNIYLHKKNKCVQLRQKSNSFLEEIKNLFHEVGIYFRNPYYDKANNSWLLWSSKRSLVDTFINEIIDFKIEGAPIVQSG